MNALRQMYHNGTIGAVKTRDMRNLCQLCKDSLHFHWRHDTRLHRSKYKLGGCKTVKGFATNGLITRHQALGSGLADPANPIGDVLKIIGNHLCASGFHRLSVAGQDM
jgi:hypothetical protein